MEFLSDATHIERHNRHTGLNGFDKARRQQRKRSETKQSARVSPSAQNTQSKASESQQLATRRVFASYVHAPRPHQATLLRPNDYKNLQSTSVEHSTRRWVLSQPRQQTAVLWAIHRLLDISRFISFDGRSEISQVQHEFLKAFVLRRTIHSMPMKTTR
jgi:hypothetical protein